MTTDKNKPQNDQQPSDSGCGSIFHRVYSVDFNATMTQALKAMEDLKSDMNAFSPQPFAKFKKTIGEPHLLQSGDEFEVDIPGPWKAPVRVVEVSPDHFRLCTLNGHLEAGEILFSLKQINENQMRFEIESEARSKDAIVDFLYDKIGIMRFAQGEMWKAFCENFASLAAEHAFTGQQKIEEVQIVTEKRDEETKQWIQI